MNSTKLSFFCRIKQMVVAGMLVFAFPAFSLDVMTNPLDAKLKRYIEAYNAKLPAMVEATLRQEQVTVFNGVLTYTYTDVGRTAAQLAPMDLEKTQKPFILPALCRASDTGRMMRDGVSFRYLYYGKDRKMAAQLIIMGADCASIQ